MTEIASDLPPLLPGDDPDFKSPPPLPSDLPAGQADQVWTGDVEEIERAAGNDENETLFSDPIAEA